MTNLSFALAGQLASCLNKLEKIITITSEEIWKMGDPPFWQIVFHIINSLDNYFATFNPAISDPEREYSLPDNLTRYAEFGFFDNKREDLEKTCISKDVLLEFLNSTRQRMRVYFNQDIEKQFDQPSGFSWIPFTKYELILHNLRHIAEHNGVLDQRLKAAGSEYVGWLGRGEI